MEALEAIKTRRSIRKYKQEDISDDIIKNIIDCGRLAPSARNEQNWEFIVVKDKSIKKQISDLAPNGKFLENAPVLIVVLCKDTKYYLEDGCAATENILIAINALGLGGCWIAGDKKPYCKAVKKMLNVPEKYKLVSLISLGFAKEKSQLHDKRKIDTVVHWEKF